MHSDQPLQFGVDFAPQRGVRLAHRPPDWAIRLLVAGVLTVLTIAGGNAQTSAVPSLLVPADAGARVPTALSGRLDTLESRAARANVSALTADEFDVEVSPGLTLRARIDRRDTHRNGARTWAGHVVGEPMSTVTVVEMQGLLQGAIRTLDAAYSIEPAPGNAFHVVRQVDPDATGVGLDPIVPSALEPPAAGDEPPVAGDDASTFDIVVFYTASARDVAGSDGAAQTRIALGVSETNTAYANSGITPRLRLVGAELLDYTESGDLGVDLSRFQNPSDGFIDAVHTRRNQLGADLVMLVVGATAGGACGVGYVMTGLSSAFAAYAFTITAYPCISPNYTFAHELGHNMGSAHAPEDGTGQGSLYPYSFGYKHPSNLFRTVMAYNCGGAGCPRVLHFSNPNVAYGGAPTGTAVQHDNARSINNAANTIANWRQAVGGGTAPTISAVGDVTIAEDTSSAPIAFTIGDAQTPAASLTVTASSNATALVPNTAGALAPGGSGANRTLVVTPTANQFGSATITLTVSDGAQTASRAFTLTVTSVADAPTLAAIAAQTTAEDTPVTVNLTVGDADTPLSSLTVQAASSDTALVGAGGFAMGGSGGARTVTITPAADQSGTATITVGVSDGTTTTSRSFALTVTAVSDPPAFAAGVPVSVSTLVSTATSFPVTVTDPDTAGAALTLTAVTTNASLLPSGGIAVVPQSSTATSRTFTVTLTPAPAASGTGGVTLTAGDGAATTTRAMTLSVTSTPAPPDAPVTLTATVTGSALQLSWIGATTGTPATSYVVSVGTAPGTTTLPEQTTSGTTIAVPVSPGATYYARVRAVNGYGTSAASPETVVTVTILEPRPGRPAQFGAVFSGRSVTLSWGAPATGDPVTNYVLEGGSAHGLADYGRLDVGMATSFAIDGVPDGTFWLRLRAANNAGTGPATADLALVVRPSGGCVGLPTAPVQHAPGVTGAMVTLSWTPPSEGVTPLSYVLVAGSAPGLSNVAVLDLGSPATSVSGPVAAGTYFVRLAARSSCGVGVLSNEVPLVVGGPSPD